MKDPDFFQVSRMNSLRCKVFCGILSFLTLILLSGNAYGQRQMERLDRGVVAVYQGAGNVFVSWRLLVTDPEDVVFNLYKKQGNSDAQKVNTDPIAGGTNFTISEVSFAEPVAFYVKPIINGVEQHSSAAFTLPSTVPAVDFISIPLQAGNYYVQHAWPADLDGDGQYELVVSRLPQVTGAPVVEAYKLDGTFLWRVDMGPNASQQAEGNGANDAPPADISGWGSIAGYRDTDNITVYDLDSDGKAEVLVRTAPGVIFADNHTLSSNSPADQFISVIHGATGIEITRTPLPQDYVQDGPLGGHLGIAYLDGIHPSLITKFENRKGSSRGSFNLLIAAYDFDGSSLTLRWKWLRENQEAHNFHQIRLLDLNGDGKDDIADGTYVINSDGTFLYTVPGAIHGDRFHITDIDPARPGLEGYGIQQYEGGSQPHYPWYYYDAGTGDIIRTGGNVQVDVGRGTIADLDPRHPGLEMWSYDGIFNVKGEKLAANMPIPNFKIWWDGDLLGEVLNRTMIDEWDYQNNTTKRVYTSSGTRHSWRNAPPFYGDILGDWREEVIWETADHSALRVYTTTIPTPYRLYTPAQNPAYRLCFTTKGYMQSTLVDYYLGDGMISPPKPNIKMLGKEEDEIIVKDPNDEHTDDEGEVTGFRQGDSEQKIIKMEVFPNPSTREYRIKAAGKFEYTIVNQLGVVVEKGNGREEVLAGKSLKPGWYSIQIKKDQAKGSHIIIKN